MGQVLIQKLFNAHHMADTGLDAGIQQKSLPHRMYTQVWKTNNSIMYKAGHQVAHDCVMLADNQGTTLCH